MSEEYLPSCHTKNLSGVPISENYHRVEAAKKAFFDKYKKGTPQNNSFSLYFYDAVSRQDFANTLPETFEKELEQYVLQSMKGYDPNNVLKSVQTYLPAFLHSVKFQIYENEMERRRNVVLYRNTRPDAECRPVYTSLTAGDDTKNRRDAIDEQQANINDVCKRRIFADESLLYANPEADMLFNKTLNRLGSKRSVPMVQNTELAPHRFLEERFQRNLLQHSDVPSLEACRNSCEENKECAGFSFVESGSDKGCWTYRSQSYHRGDKVSAKVAGWTKYYSGEVTRANSDGTYDIRFDDGKRISGVKKSQIKEEEPMGTFHMIDAPDRQKDLQRVTRALNDYKMPANKVASVVDSIRQR